MSTLIKPEDDPEQIPPNPLDPESKSRGIVDEVSPSWLLVSGSLRADTTKIRQRRIYKFISWPSNEYFHLLLANKFLTLSMFSHE